MLHALTHLCHCNNSYKGCNLSSIRYRARGFPYTHNLLTKLNSIMRQIIFTFLVASLALSLDGQSFTPIDFNIPGATGVVVGPDNHVWLNSTGTGMNDGRILRYDEDFIPETIINGLPSNVRESGELEGALNVYFINEDLMYVIIGGGPGPDFGKLALFDISTYDSTNGPMTLADAIELIDVSSWVLEQGFAESNPYALLQTDEGDLLIADAAANAVHRYSNGELSVFTEIPATPNPLPFGPPMMEPVPTQILTDPNGGYLVSAFTGFPFATGGANIYHVTQEGEITTHADGFTMITDMAYDPQDGNLLVLQFANFGEMGFEFGSAQLIKLLPDGSRETIAAGFGPSAGLGVASDGNIYASHLFLGQLLELKRCIADAGSLNIPSDRDHLSVCVGDGKPDPVSFISSDVVGPHSLVITDEAGFILSVTNDKTIDFENAGEGICMVYNVAYSSGITALGLGASIYDLAGCYSISNSITVERTTCEGCHAPLNLKYQRKSSGSVTLYWDKVRDARGYELRISYNDEAAKAFTFPTTRRKVRLNIPADRDAFISVRAICGFGEVSDYSETLVILSSESAIQTAVSRSSVKLDHDEEMIDLSEDVGFVMYPNPARQEVFLSFKTDQGYGDIEIMDLSGRLVHSQKLDQETSYQKIDISNLNVGIFIVATEINGEYLGKERLVVVR